MLLLLLLPTRYRITYRLVLPFLHCPHDVPVAGGDVGDHLHDGLADHKDDDRLVHLEFPRIFDFVDGLRVLIKIPLYALR